MRSDFPSGWSAQGSATTSAGGGSSSFPGGSQLASCLGVSQSLIDLNTPSADSPTFETKGGVDTVQDSVSVFSSTKMAAQDYGAISSAKVPGCMTTVLQGPARQEIVELHRAGDHDGDDQRRRRPPFRPRRAIPAGSLCPSRPPTTA